MMDEEDDDDPLADLFSFGADMEQPDAPAAPDDVATPTTAATATADTPTTDAATSELDELFQDHSDDAFLKMLDEGAPDTTSATPSSGDMEALMNNDPETQDILNWLDEDDTDADALLAAVADESAQKAQQRQQQQQQASKPVAAPTPAPPPAPVVPVFESLQQALESPESTKLQILERWEQEEHCTLKDVQLRPLLWCRIICGKSVDELTASSLADSFQAFSLEHSSSQNPALESWIRTESAKLAPRIVRASPNGMTVNDAEEALQSILLYHYHSNSNNTKDTTTADATTNNNDDNNNDPATETTAPLFQLDPLLPPVVCAILSAGVPKLATPVLLSHIVPSFMPFVALTPEERWEASKLLHSQFYLLACYHLPMLVYHLDRYVPGWYWPQRSSTNKSSSGDEKENNNGNSSDTRGAIYRGRHLNDQGVIPPSWLMTHLVGECGGTFLDPNRLLQLLDLVFTNDNNSLRFFLVLAVLEQHSDSWLELTGDALMDSLCQHMQDSSALTMEEWAARARSMKQATPDSVVDRLRTAEDEAVRLALKERQKKAEAALKARLEAEAAAHREAQEKKAEEARTRLTRARLVAYYRRWNPTKEENIDRIMEAYQGKFEELDKKLKKKYGVGFNPAINPNKKKKTMTEAANESMKKTMQSMNEGIKRMASSSAVPRKADNPLDEHEDTDEMRKKEHRVSVSVKVGETLPYVCMTREQANDIRRVSLQKDLPMPLRYYLVDTRSEAVAELQGRFPTAAQLSPETLMDPELLQKYEDSFEAVRGSFHICVMGEGHSAIPALYNQKLTPALEEYMREDESRTNNCALFFVKRGFPFVSVLEGGFASAHAWLLREGSKKGFDVKALLVDYNPEVSLFGQMEKIKSEQVGYKAQRALHSLLEASIPEIVRTRSNLEADEAEASKNKADATGNQQGKGSEDATGRGLTSFFGRRNQVAADKQLSNRNLVAGDKSDESANAAAAPSSATAQNRFSMWRQAAPQPAPAAQPTQQAPPLPANRFGGALGMLRSNSTDAAANNSSQPQPPQQQPMLRRNPFARFGGGGGAAAPPPGSETAKAAMTSASSAFGGFMKAANTAKPTFGRSASSDGAAASDNKPKPHQNGHVAAATIVSLPPRPDEVSANGDQGSKKPEPSLRAV